MAFTCMTHFEMNAICGSGDVGHSLRQRNMWHNMSYFELSQTMAFTCMPQFEMNAICGSWAVGHSLRQRKMAAFPFVLETFMTQDSSKPRR